MPGLTMRSFLPCAPPRRRNAGFSIIEIMIVVVIISLIALLALPAFNKIRRAAQTKRFVNDVRVFAQAFEGYATMNGSFPPNATSGVVPIGMNSDLRPSVWRATNSIGGLWNWDNDGMGRAGIATTQVTAPLSQMVEIDALIDDGDLTAGLFQEVIPGTRYIYFMKQ